MKKTILYFSFFMAAAYGTFTFCGGFAPNWGRPFLKTTDLNCPGDLYNLSLVDFFREEFSCDSRPLVEDPNPRIMLYGDSFYAEAVHGPSVRRLVADLYGLPVKAWTANASKTVLEDVREAALPPGPRLLLVGLVERNLISNVERGYFDVDQKPDTGSVTHSLGEDIKMNLRNFDSPLATEHFDYFFSHNIIFFPVLKLLRNLRFRLLGEVGNSLAPFYLPARKMLFYGSDVDSFVRVKSAELVDRVAQKMSGMLKLLEKENQVTTIVTLYPNKLTFYAHEVSPLFIYDQFLPRLEERLKFYGVHVFSAYDVIEKRNRELSFYSGSDTHITQAGKQILLKGLDEKIRTLAPQLIEKSGDGSR